MDLSQLSNDELLALKNKDYSKLSDKTLMMLKGGGAPAAAPSIGDRIKTGATKFLQSSALPTVAGTAAGLATTGASPLVSAPAAALAGGAGEAVRQIGLRALTQDNFLDQGNPQVPQTAGDAATQIGQRALEQGGAELAGRGIGAVAKTVGGPLMNYAKQGLAEGGQGLVRIPAESFKRIFENPSELFTAPLKSTVDKAYGAVEFLKPGAKTFTQALDNATASNKAFMKLGAREMEKPLLNVDPKRLFDARKAVDSEIDMLKFGNGPKLERSIIKEKLASLYQVRDGFQNSLQAMAQSGNKEVQKLLDADALHASAAAAQDFRSVVPRVNMMQSVGRMATLPLQIPAIAGGLTAGAGALAQAAPIAGRAALGAGASALDMGKILLDQMRKTRK